MLEQIEIKAPVAVTGLRVTELGVTRLGVKGSEIRGPRKEELGVNGPRTRKPGEITGKAKSLLLPAFLLLTAVLLLLVS